MQLFYRHSTIILFCYGVRNTNWNEVKSDNGNLPSKLFFLLFEQEKQSIHNYIKCNNWHNTISYILHYIWFWTCIGIICYFDISTCSLRHNGKHHSLINNNNKWFGRIRQIDVVYGTFYNLLVRDTHQCLQLKWKGGGKTVYKWKKKWCKKCRCGPKQIRRIRNRLLCQEKSLLFRIVPSKDASGQYYTCFHIFLFLEISSFAFVCKHLTDIQKLTCGMWLWVHGVSCSQAGLSCSFTNYE